MIVIAMVVVDHRADALDPLLPIGNQPMLVRAVRGLLDSGSVDRVHLVAPHGRADRLLAACRGLPVGIHAGLTPAAVGAHAGQRASPAGGDGSITPDPEEIVLLHEAARPLAPPELAAAVVAAMRDGCAAAVPALPMADTVKQVDGAGLVRAAPDRAGLRVPQTPQAIRRALLREPTPDAVLWLAESGATVREVPGHPLAFAVRTGWDLELARLHAARGAG